MGTCRGQSFKILKGFGVDLKDFRNSPFGVLSFFIIVAISSGILAAINSLLFGKNWLSYVFAVTGMIGFIGTLFSYYSFLGNLIWGIFDGLIYFFKSLFGSKEE